MAKSVNFKTSEEPKAVWKTPDFILKIQGRLAARSGKEACDAVLERQLSKCAKLENKYCIACENYLIENRKQGAAILASLKGASSEENNSGSERFDTSTTEGKRAARDNHERIQLIRAKLSRADEELSQIKEELVSAHVILDETVLSLRNSTLRKIEAFVSGVRSSKNTGLTDYREDELFAFSDKARECYFSRHIKGDTAIFSMTEKFCKENEDNA